MDSSTVVLGLRVALALACVFGLLWWAGRRMAGTPAGRRARATSLDVVARQSVGQKASVALIEVEGRRLLLGVSEHGVTLLTEVEPVPAEPQDAAERIELDPEELAALARLDELEGLVPEHAGTTAARTPSTRPTPPAARKPAVPTPRNPLEGSVLSAATWRQAVVAVQERTIRR
ncbi:flagellar biosynthetic protein FliO [Actinotalea sp.]|uniref:flagellar biosynthetic protein FliO n=1 Tax=Actinotalea sp. TaxID=1872145 RepID=UPI003563556A